MKNLLALLVILLLQIPLFAQIKTEAVPASEMAGLHATISTIILEKPVLNKPVQSNKNEPSPEYAGTTIPFNNTQLQKGIWKKTKNGVTIWRFQIKVNGAQQINLYFSNFHLLNSDLLFIYPSGEPKHYALTSENNGNFLTTEIINGNSVVLELNRLTNGKKLPFTLSEIGIIEGEGNRDFGDAGPCEVPVNCVEGEHFKKQKEGITRILVKEGTGLYWCTGTLINNTREDGTEYFLTANHCGQNASTSDFLQWLFYFNYETPDCNRPTSKPEIHSLSGSRLLASAPNSTSTGSDFMLLMLHQPIPKTYKPYFNGWDKSGNISNSGVTIHHPEGDIKMISTYSVPLIPCDYYGSTTNSNGYYWKVQWAPTSNGHGVTEGGSSGSPLFNADGLVIGSLTGGDASCNQPDSPDYYGRFWASWHPQDSDSTGQLAYWLDADNSQVDVLPGYDPYAGEVFVNFNATVTQLPEGGKTIFQNLSSGNITSYQWTFTGGEPASSKNKTPPAITYCKRGKYTVKLTVLYNGGNKSDTKQNYIEVMPAIYPNPTNTGIFNVRLGTYNKENVSLYIFNESGKEIGIFPPQFTASGMTVNLSNQKRGLYFIRIDTGEKILKYKVLSTISE